MTVIIITTQIWISQKESLKQGIVQNLVFITFEDRFFLIVPGTHLVLVNIFSLCNKVKFILQYLKCSNA